MHSSPCALWTQDNTKANTNKRFDDKKIDQKMMLSHLADTLYVETPSLSTDAKEEVEEDDDIEAATTNLHNGNGPIEDEAPAVELVGDGAVPPHPNIIKPPAADYTTYVISNVLEMSVLGYTPIL